MFTNNYMYSKSPDRSIQKDDEENESHKSSDENLDSQEKSGDSYSLSSIVED